MSRSTEEEEEEEEISSRQNEEDDEIYSLAIDTDQFRIQFTQ